MRRPIAIAIVLLWLLMLGLLLRGNRTGVMRQPALNAGAESPVRDDWMSVYHQEQKIGYTHYNLSTGQEGFVFAEESLLRMTVLQTAQTVRTRMHGHIAPDFTLRDVQFDLSSGAGTLSATGVVDGSTLRLTLHTGQDVSEQTLPLDGPVYLPSASRSLITRDALRPGHRLEVPIFDPVSFTNERMSVTVERQEALPNGDGRQAWRVREEFRGVATTTWTDGAGTVLREEGPMGFVLVRATADEALNADWTNATVLDLVASAAVPVARPIENARSRTSLRVRIHGIPAEQVPSDDEQTRRGTELTITRPPLSDLQSYRLPYAERAHAAELHATAFVQSDHPRIQAAAQAATGSEDDALRAAMRINDWVYARLRKVPTISIPNALQVLEMGAGDCNEHAVLFTALARSAGIPTRMIAGAVYVDGAFLYHAWCEIWLGRWVSIDPALHQFPVDATHIKFVVGGPDVADQRAR